MIFSTVWFAFFYIIFLGEVLGGDGGGGGEEEEGEGEGECVPCRGCVCAKRVIEGLYL